LHLILSTFSSPLHRFVLQLFNNSHNNSRSATTQKIASAPAVPGFQNLEKNLSIFFTIKVGEAINGVQTPTLLQQSKEFRRNLPIIDIHEFADRISLLV